VIKSIKQFKTILNLILDSSSILDINILFLCNKFQLLKIIKRSKKKKIYIYIYILNCLIFFAFLKWLYNYIYIYIFLHMYIK